MRTYTQTLNECMNEYADELFTFDYGMPKMYAPVFELKFLLRNGYRNIGFESYPMFKQMLRSRLMELLPRFLKLYESTETPFNPFINYIVEGTNVQRNRMRNKQYDTANSKTIGFSDSATGSMGSSERGTTGGDTAYGVNTGIGNTKDKRITDDGHADLHLFSDTPQSKQKANEGGDGQSLFNDGYITTKDYTKHSGTNITSGNNDTFNRVADEKTSEMYQNASEFTNSVNQSTGINRAQAYSDHEHVTSNEATGKSQYAERALRGVQTSEVINTWRSTFINVDEMLLDELDELFMQVY